MQTVHYPPLPGKGHVEDPATCFPASSRLPFAMPAGLVPKVMPGHVVDWQELLALEDAPNSVQRFFRYLDRQGRMRTAGEMHRYAFGNLKKLATLADPRLRVEVAESTLRAHAIPWLVAHGWLTVQKVRVRGREVSLWWCHWLLPVDPEACAFDLGHGFTTAADARPLPCRRPRRRRPVFSSTPGAGAGAPRSAPTNPDGLEERNEESTTDREDAGEVVVQAAPGGEEGPLTAEADPAPRLHPRVARALADRCTDPDFRAEVEALVPRWAGMMNVDWLVNLIVQLATNRERMRGEGRKINDLEAYAERIFRTWKAARKCLVSGFKLASGTAPNLPSPEQQAVADAERAGHNERSARLARLKAGLSEADRLIYRSEFDALFPPAPGLPRAERAVQERALKLQFVGWLDDELLRREGAANDPGL